MSKKILFSFFTLIIGGVILAGNFAMADDYGLKKAADAGNVPTAVAGVRNVPSLIGVVVTNALALVGIIFFIILLYGGLRWMTAMGDSGAVDKAKSILEAAIIGIVIVAAAYAVSNFVFSELVGV